MILLLNACKTIYVSNFCLWASPIIITREELTSLSDGTLRQIDNLNQEYQIQCIDS